MTVNTLTYNDTNRAIMTNSTLTKDKKENFTQLKRIISIRPYFILTLLLLTVSHFVANAHVEGVLFVEHPPKTAFGILAKTSWLDINSNRFAFTSAPFGEYALSKYFSIGVGLPNGYFNGQYLFSDMVVAIKTSIPVKNFMIVPMVSFEIPTGTAPATSHHTEFVSAVFLEKKFPKVHLYGYPGVRFSFAPDKEEQEEINVFGPHTENELFANVGLSYWLTDKWGIDGRVTTYYEDFEEVVPEIQFGTVLQINKNDNLTLKGSLFGFYVPNGIRKGSGVGVSFYISI